MITVLKNIQTIVGIRENNGVLVGISFESLPTIDDGFIICNNGRIASYGSMDNYSFDENQAQSVLDCKGKTVVPTWCDSHTHLVFAAPRENEFVDRIHGLSYEEIGKKGGGILNSAQRLNEMSEDQLYEGAALRLNEVIAQGTGAIEIKSGYGLSVEGELKMLRVIQRLKVNFSIPIKATFLGAHAIPKKYKDQSEKYIKVIIDEMLPVIAEEKLADFIDVFCEQNYFTPNQTDRICKAGAKYGLIPKLHVNQFNALGGIQTAVANNALSVDHLEVMEDNDYESLGKSTTMATALPGCSFFLGIPYAPVKKLIAHKIPLALASDFNPGSAPSGNMNFVVALACIRMKMTPEQAINAATLNGAHAMKLENEVGSITLGKRANFILTTPVSSYNYIPYNFGASCIDAVIINGQVWGK